MIMSKMEQEKLVSVPKIKKNNREVAKGAYIHCICGMDTE
jgi:hypothetical protein